MSNYPTHDFAPTCDEFDVSQSQRSIPFYDFFPRVHANFINSKIIPLLIESENTFYDHHSHETCQRKKTFPNEESALAFIRKFIRSARNQKIAIRHYKCKVCNLFHTTSGKYPPVIHYYIKERACHLFVYPNNTAIIRDAISSETTKINYSVINNHNGKKIIKNVNVHIGKNKNEHFIVNLQTLSKGNSVDIREKDSLCELVNSANLTIPVEKHKNIHRFIGWLSLISEENNFFYSSVTNKENNHGAVIIPSSGKGKIYIAQLYIVNNTYKLRVTEAKTSITSNGEISFKTNDSTSHYRTTSQLFIMDKTKMHSRLKELNMSA